MIGKQESSSEPKINFNLTIIEERKQGKSNS